MLDNYRDMFSGYQVTLDSGLTVAMKTLTQQITYLGLLEGLPDKVFNDRLVARLVKSGRHLLSGKRTGFRFEEPRLCQYCMQISPSGLMLALHLH